MEGAGAWHQFKAIVLPAIIGPVLVIVILRTVEAFRVFDIIYVMTRGGPADSTKTASFFVYQEYFSYSPGRSGASYAAIVAAISAFSLRSISAPCAGRRRRPRDASSSPPDLPDLSRGGALAFVTLAPIAWLFIMSIANPTDLVTVPLRWIPAHPDFSRYGKLLGLTGDITENPFLNG